MLLHLYSETIKTVVKQSAKMLSYSQGLINNSNYGIVKTEALFGFGPKDNDRINTSKPLEWLLSHNFAPRSLQVSGEVESPRGFQVEVTTPKPHKTAKKSQKHKKRKSKGVKKCIVKFLNKGGGDQQMSGGGGKKRRRHGQAKPFMKMQRRYMIPLILGLLAAKSLLIPIALKALAFLSAKGLMMGFFSTVMASVLSLKGMFDHSHGYQHRKDDSKTQVEIIQVPSKSEDHVYYNDEHYRRGDSGVREDLIRDDLVREDFIRGDLVREDLVRANLRDDLVRGDLKWHKEDNIRGNIIRSDFYRDGLDRDPVRGQLVRVDNLKGDLVRGNLIRDDLNSVRSDSDRGDLAREGLVRGELVLVN